MQISSVVEEELEKLQGTWKQVACEIDGVENAPDEYGTEPRVTFVGSNYVVSKADGTIAIKGTLRLDPNQTPKTIDWIDTFGTDAGKTIPAIYSLDNDRFMFCAADEGQPRPTEFRAGPGQVLRIHCRE
ncbi:MAG: TIGR03067 domain-containing protein [Gammaproteobacteria bacterium]